MIRLPATGYRPELSKNLTVKKLSTIYDKMLDTIIVMVYNKCSYSSRAKTPRGDERHSGRPHSQRQGRSIKEGLIIMMIRETTHGWIIVYQREGSYYSPLSKRLQRLTGCHTAMARTLETLATYTDCYKNRSSAYRALKRMEE